MVKTQEGYKRFLSGVDWRMEYGMGISVTFETAETIQSEFRHVKEVLVDWQRSRGESCYDLMLVFTAEEAKHQVIIDYVQFVVQHE